MKKLHLFLLFIFTTQAGLFSQCAMCKATAESSGAAGGLNEGIIYLMFIPYILLGAFVILIFSYRKKLLPFWKDLIGKGEKNEEYNVDNWY